MCCAQQVNFVFYGIIYSCCIWHSSDISSTLPLFHLNCRRGSGERKLWKHRPTRECNWATESSRKCINLSAQHMGPSFRPCLSMHCAHKTIWILPVFQRRQRSGRRKGRQNLQSLDESDPQAPLVYKYLETKPSFDRCRIFCKICFALTTLSEFCHRSALYRNQKRHRWMTFRNLWLLRNTLVMWRISPLTMG